LMDLLRKSLRYDTALVSIFVSIGNKLPFIYV
jgi:hypothetical protein